MVGVSLVLAGYRGACSPRHTPHWSARSARGSTILLSWDLLAQFGGPTGLRTAGRRRLMTVAKPRAPRIHAKIVTAIMGALDQQTVVVPGTAAAERVLPKLANQLASLLADRAQVAHEVEEMLDVLDLSGGPSVLGQQRGELIRQLWQDHFGCLGPRHRHALLLQRCLGLDCVMGERCARTDYGGDAPLANLT